MSVRKEYQLLINGHCVWTGSRASVEVAYHAVSNHFNFLLDHVDPSVLGVIYDSILIAFKPSPSDSSSKEVI